MPLESAGRSGQMASNGASVTAILTCPPGRRTRANSDKAVSGLGRKKTTSCDQTKSKLFVLKRQICYVSRYIIDVVRFSSSARRTA